MTSTSVFKSIHVVAFILVVIGALKWGLIGVADFNLVAAIVGDGAVSKVVYSVHRVHDGADGGDSFDPSTGRASMSQACSGLRIDCVAAAQAATKQQGRITAIALSDMPVTLMDHRVERRNCFQATW